LRLDIETATKSYTFRLAHPKFDSVKATAADGPAAMSPLYVHHSLGCLCKSLHSSAAVDDCFFVGLTARYSQGLSCAFPFKLALYYYLLEATMASLVLAHPSSNDHSWTVSCCQIVDFIFSDSSALQKCVSDSSH
jgi:hypothetical protein